MHHQRRNTIFADMPSRCTTVQWKYKQLVTTCWFAHLSELKKYSDPHLNKEQVKVCFKMSLFRSPLCLNPQESQLWNMSHCFLVLHLWKINSWYPGSCPNSIYWNPFWISQSGWGLIQFQPVFHSKLMLIFTYLHLIECQFTFF